MHPGQPPAAGAEGSFGDLLRRYRRDRGLTQQECAERAGIGVRTLRDLEQGRARPQRATAELLAAALSLHDEARTGFLAAARREPVARAGESPPGVRLPPPPALIGRDTELAELDAALRYAALVTLVGVAGVGKTALAWSVAHRIAHRHPCGVAGIAVSEVSLPADILAVVASVFEVPRAEDLPARLAGGPALLMVDGVERNHDPIVAALRWLQARATTLRVVATSRRPTGIEGEYVWPVAPLEAPPPEATGLAEISGYPATRLFLGRLRQVGHAEVGTGQAGVLAELVRQLGGLPLALELAAARGRILRLEEMLERYGGRVLDLDVPVPDGDSRTIRDALATSYQLLEPADRSALWALAQFRNRWSVELAEPMLAGRPGAPVDEDMVALLDRLVGLGLVSVRGTGAVRFRLPDVVRDFAVELAGQAGELAAVAGRHADVISRYAARTAPSLAGATLPAAVARLDDLAGDVQAALAYAQRARPGTALRLAASLPRWWRFRGRDRDGRAVLRRLLDDPRTAGARLGRAWAQVGIALLAAEHGEGHEELPELERALATFTAAGDVTGQLAAHAQMCILHQAYGNFAAAHRHGEAGLALAAAHGRTRDVVVAQTNLTWHEIRLGRLGTARRRLQAVARLAGEVGEFRLRALARANLAEVARLEGRYAEAVELGRQAVALLEELGDPRHRRRVLGIIGLAQAQSGQVAQAVLTRREVGADEGTHMIDAYLAVARGDRVAAAAAFAVAAAHLTGKADVRDVVEALVGQVAYTDDPVARSAVLADLHAVCTASDVVLLAREQGLIDGTG